MIDGSCDEVMCVFLLFPEVLNELLSFPGVQEQVIISAPCSQVLNLGPVGSRWICQQSMVKRE